MSSTEVTTPRIQNRADSVRLEPSPRKAPVFSRIFQPHHAADILDRLAVLQGLGRGALRHAVAADAGDRQEEEEDKAGEISGQAHPTYPPGGRSNHASQSPTTAFRRSRSRV